jgi:hypothetical protein
MNEILAATIFVSFASNKKLKTHQWKCFKKAKNIKRISGIAEGQNKKEKN